jgi:hypothetical protein
LASSFRAHRNAGAASIGALPDCGDAALELHLAEVL